MSNASRTSLSIFLAVLLSVFGLSQPEAARGGYYMRLRPVSSSGPSLILGSDIFIDSADLPQRVKLEVSMAGWHPQLMGSYQAAVDCSTITNGIGADLAPANQSCVNDSECTAAFGEGSRCLGKKCEPVFITTSRADFVFAAPCTSSGESVDLSCNSLLSLTATSPAGCEEVQWSYGGTISLDIPAGAAGAYAIELSPESNMKDASQPPQLFFGMETFQATVVIEPGDPPFPQANPNPDAAAAARTVGLFFAPQSAAEDPFAIRVTLTSLHHPDPLYSDGTTTDFTAFEGQHRWVGPPTQFVESSANPTTIMAATLQCSPHYLDWTTIGLIYVIGREVVPSSTLSVVTLGSSCRGNEDTCTSVSDPLEIATSRWADVEAPFSPPSASAQPDFGDVAALVNKFRSLPGALSKVRTKLQPDIPNMNTDVDFMDITGCVNAFKGKGYPFSGPLPCP